MLQCKQKALNCSFKSKKAIHHMNDDLLLKREITFWVILVSIICGLYQTIKPNFYQ
jgi:hypothetical protein